MSPLRLVKLIPFFSPVHGGPALQAAAVCRGLTARGHHVSVITSDLGFPDDATRDAWCDQDGFRVWRATTRPWHRIPPFLFPGVGDVLSERVRESDVLCLNVALTFWNVAGRKAALRCRVPYVYNAEGALCPDRLNIKRLRKSLFLGTYERRILRDASVLQAVTEVEARDLVRQGAAPERVTVIPNGVTLSEPHPPSAGAAFRSGLAIDEDALVVLFLGRLSPVKGLDLLLEAAAPVLRGEPRLMVVVAGPDEGEGGRIAGLVERAGLAHRFRWPGLLTGDRKRAAFAAADVFAQPSRSEGLPNSVLEAAAAGLPLWITNRCNVPEVESYGAGTVDPPDAARLTASLRELLCDVDGRRRRGQNAQRMVQECFALERVIDRLERVYRDLAS